MTERSVYSCDGCGAVTKRTEFPEWLETRATILEALLYEDDE